MDELSCWRYLGGCRKRLDADASKWARDNILWGLATAVAPPFLGWLTNQHIDLPMLITTCWIYAVVIFAYVGIHLIRTPWKLHQELTEELELAGQQIREKDSELRRLQHPQPERKPRVACSAHQFTDITSDNGTWREQWGQHRYKAKVLHVTNLEYEDGKGTPANDLRAQIVWEYVNGSPGPAFRPAAWIDEELGIVNIPVGCSKKLILGVKHESHVPLGAYWDGYSNPRISAGDKHSLDGQCLPSHGTFVVKLIGGTGEVWHEEKWEWEEDVAHGAHPTVKPLSVV